MVIKLPEPDTDRLSDSPLTLVVCQVRHERNVSIGDTTKVLATHESLKTSYPKISENAVQDLNVIAGPTGVQQLPGESSRGWSFRSKDDKWTAVIMPDFFALETTQYEDWSAYRERLAALTTSVAEHLAPSLEMRLGIRYVSRLTNPKVRVPLDWSGKVHDALLGALAHEGLRSGVIGSQGIVQLEAVNDINVLLRHGVFQDITKSSPTYDYLIDADCSREGARQLAVETIMKDADAIHNVALQVFQAALTKAYFLELKNTPRA